MEPVLSLDEWKARIKAGAGVLPGDIIYVRKQFVADSIKAEGDGKYTFTISTGVVDRDRDRIEVAGWDVSNFLKSGGPVLYAHQSRDLPIGKAPWVKAQGDQLKARVEFAPAEANPFAEMVRRLVDFGALKATSVGFRPLPGKAAWNEERNGIDFMAQELLEFSIVPVPSNPEALLDAKSAGVDLGPLKQWAERVLEGMEPGLWVPKTQAEALFKALAEPRVSVPAFDLDLVVLAAKEACEKRGRVLSAENEGRVRSARDAGEAVRVALDEILAQMPMEEEPKAVLMLAAPRETVLVDPAMVAAAVRDAVSETVRAQVNAARGRLD